MDVYSSINDTLVKLINEIWEVEGNAIITEEFKDITNNDMHIIEAVGLGEGRNMSTIARKLNVTVGTLTASMNSLVRKKYVIRQRSENDRRVVNIQLTEKGVAAYHCHAEYHRQMTLAVMEKITEEEVPVLMKMLEGLTGFFRGYHKPKKYDEAPAANETEQLLS